MKSIIAGLGLVAISLSASSQRKLPSADSVNLDRLNGKWFEIASIPRPGFKDCNCTVTSFRLLENGNLGMTSSCIAGDDGEKEEREYIGRVQRGSNNSKWKFRKGMLGTRYWFLEVDPAYQWVMTAHPSRRSLQILSREPVVTEAAYQEFLKGLADKFSIDTSRVQITSQGCSQ